MVFLSFFSLFKMSEVFSVMGDAKSNQPGDGTTLSQIGLMICVIIDTCMRTPQNSFHYERTVIKKKKK